MDKLESYRDLCEEIELWEIRLWDLETERTLLIRQLHRAPQTKLCANYSGMPGAGMMVTDFPKAWKEVQGIDERIEEANDVLSLKREAKKRMEKAMSQFEGIEYRVAYMRDIERKPLYEIANELGYTYQWVRTISSKTKRLKPTNNQQPA